MSNRAILLPKWRRRLRRLRGASVVLGITYLLLRAYSNWNDPDRDYKLVNFAAAWFPFAISVFVAFIPDFEKAKRMRPVWRIGIILVGLVYSVVLWVQQSVNLRAGRKDQQEAIMKAVNQANEHTDKETAERMSKLPSDVADAIVLRMSPKPTKGKIEIPSTASTTATA